jgi:hypothetical protein
MKPLGKKEATIHYEPRNIFILLYWFGCAYMSHIRNGTYKFDVRSSRTWKKMKY